MDPITGLIAGGASLLGNIFGNQQSGQNVAAQIQAQQQMLNQTEAFNAQQANQAENWTQANMGMAQQYNMANVGNQQAFEQLMSGTAYQRASADMKAAGLNPMMMFGSGSAASTPSIAAPSFSGASGPQSSVGTPSVPLSNRPGGLAGLGQAVTSAIDAMTHVKYMDKMSEETANLQAERDRIGAQTGLLKGQEKIQDPEVRKAVIRMGYPDWLANTLTYSDDISKTAGGVGSAIWDILPSKGIKGLIGSSASPAGSTAGKASVGADAVSGTTAADAYHRGLEVERQLQEKARQSESFKDWNKKIDAVRDEFERNNPGFVGEGR